MLIGVIIAILLLTIPCWADEVEKDEFWPLEEMAKYIEAIALNPVEKEELIEGALRGMLSTLDDEYAVYFDEQQKEEFDTAMTGSFGAVGLIINKKQQGVTVVRILDNMPAEYTNIVKGDFIAAVDGIDINNMSIKEVTALIRGDVGTTVTLTIIHNGGNKEEIELTRDVFEIQSVHYKTICENIGYIRIDIFSDNTLDNFKLAVQEIKDSNCQGLILDLRDNPGGKLTAGLAISSALTPKDKLLTVKGRNGKVIKEYISKASPILDIPLVVLINENSASASELVTGAIKDYGTGTIVGKTSYGKATMQQVIPLSNGGEMKITYAHYLTPNGNMIDGIGITPDVIVEDTRGQAKKILYQRNETLSYGSRGEAVKVLQQYLNELDFNAGKADGIFGQGTLQAVKKMQQAYWHTVNGEVDQAVMNELLKHLPGHEPQDAQLDKAIEIVKEKLAEKPAA